MKELSIEEKAKAYDEAIKKAESLYKVAEPISGCNVIIETLFHELKESEDEKIRKELIDYINSEYRHTLDLDRKNRFIAWLEKQGEQKPAELDENRSKELSLSLQIQAYLNTASDELYAKGKPLYSEERLKDIHKCMLMWVKLHNAYFYQKPKVEWSEEDKKMLDRLLKHFEWTGKYRFDKKDCDEARNWLKSLRSQNRWKPSNEQMEALDGICSYIRNKADWEISQDMVSDLYKLSEQLKKLKG